MRRTAVSQGSRGDVVLTAALILLALLGLILPAGVREPVASAVRRTAGVPLIQLQERAEHTRAAFLAHDSTSRVVDSLALESMDVRALRTENAHLRDLLGLAARLRWGFLVSSADFLPADALGDRTLGREVMLTLNVGSRSGVTPYAPVIAPQGVVGRVRSVDPTSSLVELYSHENFRLSAMTADQRVLGIVRPHLGDAKDEYMLEMGGVQFRDTLAAGTIIYTSGLGGTFPAYVPVGTVVRELGTAEMWARTYLLRPVVRPGDIRTVIVLRPERGIAGVEGVWVSAPDSAARAAAATGDSIRADSVAVALGARTAALRQQLLDSLKAAGALAPPAPPAAGGQPAGGQRPLPTPSRPVVVPAPPRTAPGTVPRA
ncbi:MAG: rod shape-determining protein MreC, partial [Gemmatimonadaceae bacterium]